MQGFDSHSHYEDGDHDLVESCPACEANSLVADVELAGHAPDFVTHDFQKEADHRFAWKRVPTSNPGSMAVRRPVPDHAPGKDRLREVPVIHDRHGQLGWRSPATRSAASRRAS